MRASEKLVSSVKGLKYPSGRDGGLRNLRQWLDGKRRDDGAEGLWRIGDKLYDLNEWAKNHPGGAEWIELSRGTDITEAFEVHHILPTAERLLPKFYARDAVSPRSSPFTFAPDGFYKKFKERARAALKNVNIHASSTSTNLVADTLCICTILLCILAAATGSWILIIASGIFLTGLCNISHNFVHQKNSFRMHYMDLTVQASEDWRVSHALSHHIYTNTVLDLEISVYETFLNWLPRKDKSFRERFVSHLYTPILYVVVLFLQYFKRYYSILFEKNKIDYREAIRFVIPLLMCLAAPPLEVFTTWLKILAVNSFCFATIGLNVAHHHPDIFHDGDAHREDMDWGLAQLDAVRDRVTVEDSTILVLTTFGHHTLHHLLPTVDHAYLNLCEPAFRETCKEFNVDTSLWTTLKLFKGQFAQLRKVTPKLVPNTR